MFNLGDIVKPQPFCLGHNYLFKVISKKESLDKETLYELEGIIQRLNPINGSKEEQLKEIKALEDALWDDSSLELIESMPEIKTNLIDNKEENEMQILDLYEERKIEIFRKILLEAKEKVKKEDEIQSIILEMTNQVNTILENQGRKIKYEFEPNLITTKTEVKLDELDKKYHEEIENLRSTLDEIRALFELTDDYNERIKILKNYDILDKKGKLNI